VSGDLEFWPLLALSNEIGLCLGSVYLLDEVKILDHN